MQNKLQKAMLREEGRGKGHILSNYIHMEHLKGATVQDRMPGMEVGGTAGFRLELDAGSGTQHCKCIDSCYTVAHSTWLFAMKS